MDAGSARTRTSSGTSLSEMVTPRLETMAENSRFKKKVHFGGTVWPHASLFPTRQGGAGRVGVAGYGGDGSVLGVFEK